MTEAMSRREIEDVLTSIKRLVSQEVKGRVTAAVSAPAPEKLVLTPSLRVHEGAELQAPSSLANPQANPLLSDTETSRQTSADHVLPDISASDEQEPVHESPWPADPVFSVGQPDVQGASDLPEIPAEPVNASSLLRRIAQAGTPQSSAPIARHMPQAAAQPDIQPAPEHRESLHDILVQPAEDAELEATLARLEAVLSGKAQPKTQDAAQSLPETAPGSRADPPAGEQIIDEGMLYQLVAHIVRQELQGELGEKITRNIRKLVRSEVARELQLRRP